MTDTTDHAATLLRPARKEDEPVVMELLEQEKLETIFRPDEFVVAYNTDGQVVAAARMRPLPGGAHELASVVVDSRWRGQGIGSRLVRHCLESATGPVWALALAPDFFHHLGFIKAAEIPPSLQAKAEGVCAGQPIKPLVWNLAADEGAPLKLYRAIASDTLTRVGTTAPTPTDAAAVSCGTTSCGTAYSPQELATMPPGARNSLGTGNPVREAGLQAGQTVVDLGSGAGIDLLLAARIVGPTGEAIGIDATPEMVELAQRNAHDAKISNARFLHAPIEGVPLDDQSVDVVISNCVLNLVPDKVTALKQAHRILRPGGRLVISDVLREEGPGCAEDVGCATSAFTEDEWRQALQQAGLVPIRLDKSIQGSGPTLLVEARRQ